MLRRMVVGVSGLRDQNDRPNGGFYGVILAIFEEKKQD
jgi:hypothetical protein